MVLELIVSFLCGVFLSAVLVAVGVLSWLYSNSWPAKSKDDVEEKPYIPPQLPQSLQNFLCVGEEGFQIQEETCHWFNLIVAFVFHELRDSATVKRFVMKKMNKEFEELMFTKTEGRMIEQLTVRDYFLGTSMPIIRNATVAKVVGGTGDSNLEIQEMDINLDIEYTGKCEMAIDADVVFDKAAYVAVEVMRVEGKGRLRFSRKAETCWSFTFLEDPLLELKVNSLFEGRGYPHLSSIIESQIRKWVKRKHTLPAYKIRYKPFFRKFKPQNQLLDVYVHDDKLTVGKLYVTIVECSRLPDANGACSVYCTVTMSSSPWQPVVHLWKTQWPVHEFVVQRRDEQTIGIIYKMVSHEEESDHSSMVIVSKVVSPSAAYSAGVKKGDVLTRVNNVKVTSVNQAKRLMKKFKDTSSILIMVQRPPAHFASRLFSTLSSSPSTRTPTLTTTDGNSSADPGSVDAPVLVDMPAPLVTEATPTPSTPMAEAPRQSSHTPQGQGAASMLGESIPPLRTTHTPISSEDEKDAMVGRLVRSGARGRRGESDTVSLYGVTGEVGVEGVEALGEPQQQVRMRQSPAQSTTEETRSGSARASPLLTSHHSSPSPPATAVPLSGDSVDIGAVRGVMEGAGRSREAEGRGEATRHRSREENLMQKKTREVQARKNPVWNQKFRLNINDGHCYLNVCVWEKLLDERGDLLIGHITLPLMDVAMQCLHTQCSTHQQRYALVAACPARASISRAAAQATAAASGASVKKKATPKLDTEFAGDILLKFKHSPKVAETENHGQSAAQELRNEGVDRQPFHPNQDELPSSHNFAIAEYDGIQKCDICRKKIWTLKRSRVYRCRKCGLKCHRKCVEYCMKEVYCRRDPALDEVYCRRDPALDADNLPSPDGSTEINTTHRHLEQQEIYGHRLSESFEVLCGPEDKKDGGSGYSTADDVVYTDPEHLNVEEDEEEEEDGLEIRRAGPTAMGGFDEQYPHETVGDVGGESSEYERLFTPLPESDMERSSGASQQLKWSVHLHPDDREAAINKRLSDIQTEINCNHERITNLYDTLRAVKVTDSEKRTLEIEIEKYEEKLKPLKLLMNEMMSELAHCISHHS